MEGGIDVGSFAPPRSHRHSTVSTLLDGETGFLVVLGGLEQAVEGDFQQRCVLYFREDTVEKADL